MNYDVVIVGGGLAGLSLSIDLRKRGYNVIVIEKGNYPRHKVCGEYISMESHNYLKSILPCLDDLNLPHITNFKLSSTSKKQFSTALDLGGFGISRYLLEELLFTEAKNNGVKFLLNTKVLEIKYDTAKDFYSIKTNTNDISSSIVCNSSGRKSNLEVKESITNQSKTNYVGIKYHIKLNRDSTLIEIHNFPGGYCGISNIEENKVCLCYIVNADKLKAVQNSIPELERQFLYQNPQLKKIFTESEFIFKEPITISGINFLIKKSVSKTHFYLGDAAGSIAPITGNGMSIALRSASVLAKNIDLFLSNKISKTQLTHNYTQFWDKEFGLRIKLSRYFQKLSEYPFLTKPTISLFNLFPFIAKIIIKQTHGKPF